MSYTIVGEQIQRFRKELRITQKELGEAIGVSSSAVSQWESGGTPDISLLPAIADRLGVTVDALFGREEITRENMSEALPRHIASLPEQKRVNEICRLMWEAMKRGCVGPYMPEDRSTQYYVYYTSDEGVMLGTFAEDLSFMSVFPEPEKGYDVYFASDEEYVRLFSTLVRPHALALLKLLYQRPPRHCTAGVIAHGLGVSREEAEALLEEFEQLQLVGRLELEAEEGIAVAYKINDWGALVPFLYAARLMMKMLGDFRLECSKRKAPLLRSPKQGE